MVTIQHYWLWSFALLFVIWIGSSGSSPSVLRSNGAMGDPLAELELSSCSQRLEKLKMETQRHILALNAITDSSTRASWRNRRLLSSMQPIESKLKSKSKTLLSPEAGADYLVKNSMKTEEDVKNSLVKYLSSLDHTGWVRKCLDGGKCSMTDSHNEETEKLASEPPSGSMSDTKNISKSFEKTYTQKSANKKNITVEGAGEKNTLATNKLLLNVPTQQNVSDPVNTQNFTKFNGIIDLLPSSYEPHSDSRINEYRPKVEGSLMINDQNYTSLSNESVTDNNSYISGKHGVLIDASIKENTNKPIEYTKETLDFMDQLFQKGSVDPEPVYFSSMINNREEPSSDATANDSAMPEDQKSFLLIDSPGNLPNSNRLVNYNNNFLPLTIQFTPMTYYQRYPRSRTLSRNEALVTSSGIEETFVPNTEIHAPSCDHSSQQLLSSNGVTDEQGHDIGSLDNLVANYGNDLFKRGFTGKRESEFSTLKKDAVTTNYPEVPSSHTSAGTADGQIFTRVAPGENGSESNIYLFVGGNWIANFKDNPRLFYIQPQTRQSEGPHTFTGAMENSFGPPQPSHQPSSSTNPNCPYKRILASPPELNPPPKYSQPSYAVDERNFERSTVPSIVTNARAANLMKVPSMVAARNGYEWYDYDIMTNDIYTKPMNGQYNGGHVASPNTVESSNIPDENKKGVYRPNVNDLNYEDSLVNFPPIKYEPPAVGLHDASIVKPEEFMEHDINMPDMFVVGTQLLTTLPLVPSEHHTNDTNDLPYGQLVADVSSRSSPEMNAPMNPGLTVFTNTALKTHESVNSPRGWPPNRSDSQFPSTYFSTSRPNEFEFVSGQWVKRKPVSVMSGQGFIYDQVGQRRIRDILAGGPGINTLNHNIQQPSTPYEDKCFSESKRLGNPHEVLQKHILPQEGQLAYLRTPQLIYSGR